MVTRLVAVLVTFCLRYGHRYGYLPLTHRPSPAPIRGPAMAGKLTYDVSSAIDAQGRHLWVASVFRDGVLEDERAFMTRRIAKSWAERVLVGAA